MIYINAFIFVGVVCLIGQLILDNTKLTPGHVTSIFVVIGAVLGMFNLYEPIRTWAGTGASLPIVSFGDLLFKAAFEGYQESGILGIFSNMLTLTSAGIVGAIVFAFILSLFSKPKD